MEATLALLVQGIRVVSRVQLIVKVNAQVFVFCQHVYVQTLDVHWCEMWSLPLKVDHHFLCFLVFLCRWLHSYQLTKSLITPYILVCSPKTHIQQWLYHQRTYGGDNSQCCV